jgi:hypothetical protein
MPFQIGNKLGPGRAKGAVNKRTVEFQAVLEKNNFNVAESLLWCFNEAKKQYIDYRDRFQDGRISPMEDNAPKYLKIASDMAKDLASYTFPKLKSVEHMKDNPWVNFTDDQKIEMAKKYIENMELKKQNGNGINSS